MRITEDLSPRVAAPDLEWLDGEADSAYWPRFLNRRRLIRGLSAFTA
jgi:hypothetical protein